MFTGIVTDLGRVRTVSPGAITRFVLDTGFDTGEIAHGASIACNGCCLSVVDKGAGWFAVEASAETLAVTMYREGFILFNQGYSAGIAVIIALAALLFSYFYLRSVLDQEKQI